MHKIVRATQSFLLVMMVAACASAGGSADGTSRPRARQDLITLQEMQAVHFSNAYELVANLRPRWLQARGVDTIIGKQGEVQVHMDGNRLGGVNALRNISTGAIQYLEFVDPIDASGRFGLDHGHGAILVSTRAR